MQLVIISGAEATCKSTIGKHVAQETGFKYLSKDVIKEALFDSVQHTTWDYRWYESRAKAAFFKELQALVANRTSYAQSAR